MEEEKGCEKEIDLMMRSKPMVDALTGRKVSFLPQRRSLVFCVAAPMSPSHSRWCRSQGLQSPWFLVVSVRLECFELSLNQDNEKRKQRGALVSIFTTRVLVFLVVVAGCECVALAGQSPIIVIYCMMMR